MMSPDDIQNTPGAGNGQHGSEDPSQQQPSATADLPTKQLTLPQFNIGANTASEHSSKRKAQDPNENQTPSKAMRRFEYNGEGNQMKVLNQILTTILSLQTKVDSIETSVSNLKDEILIREVPINTSHKLDTLIADMDSLKKKILDDSSDPEMLSTQAALASVSVDMDADTSDQGGSQSVPKVVPSEVIGDWKEYLIKRKVGFNKYLSNEGRYKLHKDWNERNPQFIPAEYLPKEMHGAESQKEYELRRKSKAQMLEVHMELLAARRDEGLAEFTSVDTHIEETIDELVVDTIVKDALKVEYQKQIKTDEESCRKQWENAEKGLKEKPERETASKIVVVDGRVYARGRSQKKAPKKKEVQKGEDTPPAPVTKVLVPEKTKAKQPVKSAATEVGKSQWKTSGKKQSPWRPKPPQQFNQQPQYNYNYQPAPYQFYQQPAWNYQPPAQVYQQPHSNFQYQVPVQRVDMGQPPPQLGSSWIRGQPETCPFPLSNQQNQWTHLNPNVKL